MDLIDTPHKWGQLCINMFYVYCYYFQQWTIFTKILLYEFYVNVYTYRCHENYNFTSKCLQWLALLLFYTGRCCKTRIHVTQINAFCRTEGTVSCGSSQYSVHPCRCYRWMVQTSSPSILWPVVGQLLWLSQMSGHHGIPIRRTRFVSFIILLWSGNYFMPYKFSLYHQPV